MIPHADPLAIGDPGRAARELGPGLPSRYPDCSDHELSACAVPGAEVRAASVRGLLHRYRDQPRQDRFSIAYDQLTGTLVVTVCDGVGQFDLSQEAAGYVALHTPQEFFAQRSWPAAVESINTGLTEFAAAAATRSRLDPAPADSRMATTLAAVAIDLRPDQRTASVAWTDDSAVWSLADGLWTKLTIDDTLHDDGSGLHSGRVHALPNPEPRLRVTDIPISRGALFVMTDGVDVPMSGAQQVRDTLADWWQAPPDVFTFGQQVGFARKTHIDDRTVVGIWFDQP